MPPSPTTPPSLPPLPLSLPLGQYLPTTTTNIPPEFLAADPAPDAYSVSGKYICTGIWCSGGGGRMSPPTIDPLLPSMTPKSPDVLPWQMLLCKCHC